MNGRALTNARPNFGAFNWQWDGKAQEYVWALGRKDRNKRAHAVHGNMPFRVVGRADMEQLTTSYSWATSSTHATSWLTRKMATP